MSFPHHSSDPLDIHPELAPVREQELVRRVRAGDAAAFEVVSEGLTFVELRLKVLARDLRPIP
jgi:hypothetical protein